LELFGPVATEVIITGPFVSAVLEMPSTESLVRYTLTGNPSTPQHGNVDIDIASYVEARKDFATTILTADTGNATFGSSSNHVTVYSDATQQGDGELTLNNLTGHGILAVKGNLQLAGNINWNGLILVTGIITSSGGGSNSKNIMGQIYSGISLLGDSAVTGSVTVGYDGCKVTQAIEGQPLRVRSRRTTKHPISRLWISK